MNKAIGDSVQSNEYGFPQWAAGGLMLRGWARVEVGEIEAGLADIRSSIRGLERTGTLIWMQFAHYLLARALVADEQWAKATEVVDRLLAEIKAAGGRWYEAEVARLRGDILRGQHKPLPEIEACYESAIAIARRQGARAWELKAMESLEALREAGTGHNRWRVPSSSMTSTAGVPLVSSPRSWAERRPTSRYSATTGLVLTPVARRSL